MALVAVTSESKVWRYLSFPRFVWLLQQKKLWLARVDTLDDAWESALAGDQLAYVIKRHPAGTEKGALEHLQEVVTFYRETTFVNCWCAADHESHALWRIYCGREGVAVQTTFKKLQISAAAAGLRVFPIDYGPIGMAERTPTVLDLVTKKRPMFDYEREVRIVLPKGKFEGVRGHKIDWDPSTEADAVFIHPEADETFFQTTTGIIDQYAPSLRAHTQWSAMKEQPPWRSPAS